MKKMRDMFIEKFEEDFEEDDAIGNLTKRKNKMWVGIRNGKVWDITSHWENRRDEKITDITYYQLDFPEFKYMNIDVGDTWLGKDSEEKTLRDSLNRTRVRPLTKDQQKIKDLEDIILNITKRLEELEK